MLIVRICTGYQATLSIKVHPIGATALITEQRYLSRHAVPTVNLIIGLVCKIDIAPRIYCWSFCKAIRIR